MGRQDEAGEFWSSTATVAAKHRPPVAAAQNDTSLPYFPQTVEAMQAILDDLTIDDYFSIIDFNHNVRCWSEELVPGSSIQVKDAKRYIQNIRPNGGETPFRRDSLL